MQEDKDIEEYVTFDDSDIAKDGNLRAKIIGFLESGHFLTLVVILLLLVSFFLGRISALQNNKSPVRVLNQGAVLGSSTSKPSLIDKNFPVSDSPESKPLETQKTGESVVASKNGTKYHYPWCSGAKQIADKNKITFASIEEARAKGFTPAANCPGLK